MTRSDWAAALTTVPVAVLAVAWLAVLAVASTGEHPIWDVRPRNVSEAAAFRDGGTVVRRVWRGENAAVPAEVRGGFISDEPVSMTAIDAAVDARRPEIVQLLLDLGVTLDEVSWLRAQCAATDPDIQTIIAPHRPEGAATECGDEQPQP